MTSFPEPSANEITSMFSRLLHSTRSIFPVSKPPLDAALTVNPDQQLQTEFAQAIEEGMVATRSQDHTLDDLDVQDLVDQTPLSLRLKKRKVAGGEDVTPDEGAARKRRRTEAESKVGGIVAADASTHTEETSMEQSGGNLDDDGDEPLRRDSAVSRTTSDISYTSQRNDNGDEEARISVKEGVQDSETPRLVAQGDNKDTISSLATLQTTRQRKKPSKKETTDGNSWNGRTSKDELYKSISGKVPPALKATKKRFGSEDIEVPITTPKGPEVKDVLDGASSDAGGESEDEAPETVTASAGLEKARAKAFDAAETVARFEADQKTKRRERDKRLKTQAKSAKKHAKVQREPDPEDTTIEGQKPEEKAKRSAEAPLPILLSEEILAAEPVVRPPTPPSSTDKAIVNQKHKFLDVESRPPKDIKRGNVKIRVLQEERSILPPKASQSSKALRESWLAGRQGFKGNIVIPRRKLGGGFVRN